jgi:hypothetical protein
VDLTRAVRGESAAAVRYWWGVGPKAVWRWRRAPGVGGRDGTEGSRRLIQAAAAKGGAGMRARGLTDRERRQRRKRARELDLGQYLEAARQKRAWSGAGADPRSSEGLFAVPYLVDTLRCAVAPKEAPTLVRSPAFHWPPTLYTDQPFETPF